MAQQNIFYLEGFLVFEMEPETIPPLEKTACFRVTFLTPSGKRAPGALTGGL